MNGYNLEFILNTHNTTLEFIHNSLVELGEGLRVTQLPGDADSRGEDFKISISVSDPTVIFDTCAQLGKIKSVKAEERS